MSYPAGETRLLRTLWWEVGLRRGAECINEGEVRTMCKAIVYWETLGPVNVSFDMAIDLSIIPDQVQTARQDPPTDE